MLYACRALASLPSQEPSHDLFKWAQDLLHALVSAGADIHARDQSGASPAILGSATQQRQRSLFLEGGSLYEAVWPRVRAISTSLSGARFKSIAASIHEQSTGKKATPKSRRLRAEARYLQALSDNPSSSVAAPFVNSPSSSSSSSSLR